jgi:protein-tyrosine phosphatase
MFAMRPDSQDAAEITRGNRRRRFTRRGLFALLTLLLSPLILLLRPWYDGNLGILDPGRAFRSAQPTHQLDRIIENHRLSSILNLRGGSSKDWWYTAEVATAEKNNVAFFDLPMSATRRPTRRELLLLIDVMNSCKYPLLIHCKAGADRTGLASAVYLMTQKNLSPREALNAFTIYHSHVPMFGAQHLHEPLNEYADWLDAEQLTHTPERFRDWVKFTYQSKDANEDPPSLSPGPRRPRDERSQARDERSDSSITAFVE